MTANRNHRFAAFALAAVMTLAMLASVDGLARVDGAADQMARATPTTQA